MEPKMLDREGFMVMGLTMRMAVDCTDSKPYETIWKEFETHTDKLMPHSTDRAYYGMKFPPSDDGFCDYIAGVAVPKDVAPVEDMVTREVPAASYAVFECPVEAIGPTYQFVFAEWFPSSGYEPSPTAPVFEQYPPADDLSAPVLIHIPVGKKTN